LPDADLEASQRNQLRNDIYRTFLLLATLHAYQGAKAGWPSGGEEKGGLLVLIAAFDKSKGEQSLRSAREILARAHAFRPSRSGTLVGICCDMLLGDHKKGPAADLAAPPSCAADYHLLGLAHFSLKWYPDDAIVQLLYPRSDEIGVDVKNATAVGEAYLRTALQLEPQQYFTHAFLGRVLAGMSRYQEAELAASTCIALRPDYESGYSLRAEALAGRARQAGDLKRQEQLLKHAVADIDLAKRLNPSGAYAKIVRGSILHDQGKLHLQRKEYDQAIRCFTEAIEVNAKHRPALRSTTPDFGYYWSRVLAYQLKGDLAKAMEERNEIVRQNPDVAEVYGVRGQFHFDQRNFPNAIMDFTEAIKRNGNRAWWLAQRGDAYRLTNELAKALTDLNESLRLQPTLIVAHDRRGHLHMAMGNRLAAIADFTEIINVAPKDLFALWNRSWAYQLSGDRDKALADLHTAIVVAPTSTESYVRRGRLYQELGDFKKAVADFSEVLRFDPRNPVVRVLRGQAYQILGDKDKALLDFDAAVEADPKRAEGYLRRAELYSNSRELEKALGDLDIAIQLEPKNPAPLWTRARMNVLRDQTALAEADFAKAIAFNAQNSLAHGMRGDFYLDIGDYEKAIADYGEASRLDKIGPHWLSRRVTAWLLSGKLVNALDDCNEMIRRQPKFFVGYQLRGTTRFLQKKFPDAIEDYDIALKMQPTAAAVHCDRANVYRLSAELKKAQADVNEALRLQPNLAEAHKMQGVVYLVKGDIELAKLAVDRAVLFEPYGSHRWYAARVAALAAAGKDPVAPKDGASRGHYRELALAWLRADLDFWNKQLEDDRPPPSKAAGRVFFSRWKSTADLTDVRDATALVALSEAERKSWNELWSDVDGILKRLGKK
jgi:tetratricopeptide (TPR) repeat protein